MNTNRYRREIYTRLSDGTYNQIAWSSIEHSSSLCIHESPYLHEPYIDHERLTHNTQYCRRTLCSSEWLTATRAGRPAQQQQQSAMFLSSGVRSAPTTTQVTTFQITSRRVWMSWIRSSLLPVVWSACPVATYLAERHQNATRSSNH